MQLKGGKYLHLKWHDRDARPIVVMSPVVKLTEGPEFTFAVQWALMQYHAWTDRRFFIDMLDEEVKKHFRGWRLTEDCP